MFIVVVFFSVLHIIVWNIYSFHHFQCRVVDYEEIVRG